MWTTLLGATDVTSLVTVQRTPRLSRPSSVTLSGQAEQLTFTPGVTPIRLYENGTLKFHGRAYFTEYDGGIDDATVKITAQDPMIYWPLRLVQDALEPGQTIGDFSKPHIISDYITGPQIMAQALQNTIDADGEIGLEVGNVELGGASLVGAPTDWPMSLDDLRKLFLQSGELDIVVNPIEPSGTQMGTVDFYAGSYGTDLSGSVVLSWGTAGFNVQGIKRTIDMSTVCNRLWYFLGPKCDDQHWRGNVTRDDPCLPGNDGLDSLGNPICFPPAGPGGQAGTSLGNRIDTSRSDYFSLMEVKIYDDYGGNCDDPIQNGENAFRPLYQRLWQNESWIRAVPRNLVSWTPVDDYVVAFGLGDLVTVEAGARLGGGFTGIQRIYEFTQNIDRNGTVTTTNIVTSADQEGV